MSEFRVGVLIEGDSSGGVRALDQTAKASQNASSATAKMGQTAAKSSTQTEALRRAEDQAAAAARKMAAANAAAATTATQMGAANATGARHVANLTAQFNDIGVMLAAGQNPLQLALQQGTQITQVIGPMGAAGAVKALSGAFVSMINPMSLVTLGVIAGGAALVQWGMSALSAGEDIDELLERVDAAREKIGSLQEEMRGLILGATAEEVSFIDQIKVKTGEIAALEEKIADSSGYIRRNAQRELKSTIEQRAELQGQLNDLREALVAKEAFLAATDELAEAERAVGAGMQGNTAEIAEAEGMAGLLRDGIQASVIQAMQLAGVDMTSPISAANLAAAELASNLGIAFEQARNNLALQSQMSYSGRGGDPRGGRFVPTQETLDAYNEMNKPTRARTGGRSGASAADAERKAVEDLLSSLNQELAILRELDPVQQEMIRHRDVLGAATTQERETVEQLIATREQERTAMELAQENMEAWKDATGGILDELISSGGDLESVFDSVSKMLIQMVQQALMLGEGPLAGLLGTAGKGAINAFVGSFTGDAAAAPALPAKAEGGMIYGPGSGTSDDVLMWGSSGEFVMNAKATQKHRHLLEAMNSGGGVPGFATGGIIGSGSAAPAGFGGVSISIENRGSAAVTGEVQEQSDGAGGRKLTLVLADQVGAALTTKGGGARRALMNNYGVRPMGSKR